MGNFRYCSRFLISLRGHICKLWKGLFSCFSQIIWTFIIINNYCFLQPQMAQLTKWWKVGSICLGGQRAGYPPPAGVTATDVMFMVLVVKIVLMVESGVGKLGWLRYKS